MTANETRNKVLCAVCLEHLGYIMYPDDPDSHQSGTIDLPIKGVFAVCKLALVHVLGEKVHTGRIVECTKLILGEPQMLGLDALENIPVDTLRYRGMSEA